MNNLAKLLLIGGLLWILFGQPAPASAATRPERESGGGGGGGGGGSTGRDYPDYGRTVPIAREDADAGIADAHAQAEDDWTVGTRLYGEHRADFDANPAPLPPTMIGVVMARESGGRDVTSPIGEAGPMQLSSAEIAAAGGGDPHNMRDAIRMAQIVYQRAIDRRTFDNAVDETFFALLSRSIGGGAARWLLDHIGGDPSRARVVDRTQQWLSREPSIPSGISQTPRKWILRIARAMLRAQRAGREGIVSTAAGAHLARFGGRTTGTTPATTAQQSAPAADDTLTPAGGRRLEPEGGSSGDSAAGIEDSIRSPTAGPSGSPGTSAPGTLTARNDGGFVPAGGRKLSGRRRR